MSDIFDRLEATIAARKIAADPNTSHVARLLHKGALKCAQKFGEEAVETVIAASVDDRAGLISESADMIFHWLVMLAARGVKLSDIRAELERREGLSGLTEKAQRRE